MWTRKDFTMLAVAAVGTFGMTVAVLLPRTVSAVDDAPVTTAIPVPVLKVGDCEVTAVAKVAAEADKDGTEAAVGNGVTTAPNLLMVGPNEAFPRITITIKNTTAKAAKAAFTATVTGAVGGSAVSRVAGPRMVQEWAYKFNVDLKPGETRELDVNTGVKMASGYATLGLTTVGKEPAAINALTFNVMERGAQSASVSQTGTRTVRVGQRVVSRQ